LNECVKITSSKDKNTSSINVGASFYAYLIDVAADKLKKKCNRRFSPIKSLKNFSYSSKGTLLEKVLQKHECFVKFVKTNKMQIFVYFILHEGIAGKIQHSSGENKWINWFMQNISSSACVLEKCVCVYL
jgi:hypothetical protein